MKAEALAIGDVACGARRGDVYERLRRLRIKAHAGHVLRKHGDEGQTEALIKIRDELVARHFFELAIVAEALLERQVPVHVVGIPPGVLQALPEEARLADAADFVAACDDAFFAILADEFAQGVDELRLEVIEALVVGAKIGGLFRRAAIQGGIFLRVVRGGGGVLAGRRAEARRYTQT